MVVVTCTARCQAGPAMDYLGLQGGRQQAAGQQACADSIAQTRMTRMQQASRQCRHDARAQGARWQAQGRSG